MALAAAQLHPQPLFDEPSTLMSVIRHRRHQRLERRGLQVQLRRSRLHPCCRPLHVRSLHRFQLMAYTALAAWRRRYGAQDGNPETHRTMRRRSKSAMRCAGASQCCGEADADDVPPPDCAQADGVEGHNAGGLRAHPQLRHLELRPRDHVQLPLQPAGCTALFMFSSWHT